LTRIATPPSFGAMQAMKPETLSLFVTRVHRALVPDAAALNADIVKAARVIAKEDAAGRRWCRENSYPGYTSYGSLTDLTTRAPCFAALKKAIDREARAFSNEVCFDLGGGRLKLDNMWINILEPGGFHAGHIHPYSVISGTYYARVPDGAAALKLEDPRLAMMMAAPPRTKDAPEAMKSFVYLAPSAGMIVLWESWLRHEVVRNGADSHRVSVSFNYRWA
jgi:uncharacterized protein (TIGR02466 family)